MKKLFCFFAVFSLFFNGVNLDCASQQLNNHKLTSKTISVAATNKTSRSYTGSVNTTHPAFRTCGTIEVMNRLKQEDPTYNTRLKLMETQVQQFIANQQLQKTSAAVITIPVVFHVVYKNGTQNISDAQILSQITVLNEDFRKKNADTSNTPSVFKSFAADVQIEFCLAQQTSSGTATTGITRTSTTHGPFTLNDDVKFTSKGGKDIWDRNKYLNIWVCDIDSSTLGYAQFPGGPSSSDGVVIGYQYVGRSPDNPFPGNYALGRTATHEVGHWLGLYHIWGDDGGACTGTDNVTDTPNSADSYYGCPTHPQNSCGVDNMFMDYMDYTDDNCMNMFTTGQGTRMLSFLNSSRLTLKTSIGCQPLAAPVANFGADKTSITPNTTVYFTDSSTNNPTSWSWDFGDGNISTAKNPSNNYTSVGVYTVKLTATNSVGSDTEIKNNYITVQVIPPVANFSSTAIGLTVNFTDLTTNTPTSWLWNFGDGATSTVQNPSYTYAKDSSYIICLTATNSAGFNQYCDTITVGIANCQIFKTDATDNATGYTIYGAGGGYVSGTNKYGDIEKGMSFSTANPGTISEVWVYFARKQKVGSSDTYKARIYADANNDKLPDTATVLGISTFTTDSVDTTNWTRIVFSTPAIVSGGFSVGIEVDNATNNDTLGILSNIDGNGKGLKKSWERWGDNSLVTMFDAWAGLDIDLVIQPLINYGPAPIPTITATDVSCTGYSNGTADLTVTFGTSPFTYNWSNGSSTQDLTGLAAGTYSITLKDANGCFTNTTTTIKDAVAYSLSVATNNISCNGINDGAIDLSVTGGNTPYTYMWSSGTTTQDLSSLSAGVYTATVSDNKGCKLVSSSTITQPLVLSGAIAGTNISCNGNSNGSANLTVSGGTPPYFFSWSNVSNVEDQFNLAGGTYTVTFTDANSCKAGAGVVITEPTALSLNLTKTDVNCNGSASGAVNSTLSGGTVSYTYKWSTGATTASISGLSGGNYTLTVTDGNSCKTNGSVTIVEPTALSITITSTNTTCNNTIGAASVTASGGTVNYTYKWSNGAGTSLISNLGMGNYFVTVIDGNSCMKTGSLVIVDNGTTSLSLNKTDATCNGKNDGSITLAVTGGTSPFTYYWSNGETTQNISSIIAGTYIVTVIDGSGCKAISSLTVNEPSLISINLSSTNISCNGGINGSATVSISGGTPSYLYLWSNGNTTSLITNLAAGTYNCTITDTNNCKATSTTTIAEPTGIILTTSSSEPNCGASDGSVTATVSGGAGTFTYAWSNGNTTASITSLSAGTYTVTVKDANGCIKIAFTDINEAGSPTITATSTDLKCNEDADGAINITVSAGTAPYTYKWSNGVSTEDLTGLSGGTYIVTVIGGDGCKAVKNIIVNEPSQISITPTITDISCNDNNDGAISTNVMGGTPPHAYSWSNGSSAADISNLTTGNYTVSVTDANGCKTLSTITVGVETVLDLSITTTLSDSSVNNGTATVAVTGGTSPYTFIWSNGENTSAVSNLAIGTYTVTVKDVNGCWGTDTAVVSPNIGIKDITISGITIYPNPVRNELFINATLIKSTDLNIDIYNMLGTKLMHAEYMNSTTFKVRLQLSELGAGIYFVQIKTLNEVMTERITVVK